VGPTFLDLFHLLADSCSSHRRTPAAAPGYRQLVHPPALAVEQCDRGVVIAERAPAERARTVGAAGAEPVVGEFRKTRHPRNVELNKVLKACFSGAGISRFSEAWNL
jgi:hypothetical protein